MAQLQTTIPGEPSQTDDEWRTHPMRTWFYHNAGDPQGWSADHYLRKNPWRAPGQAPVFSPCGISGGNPLGCPRGNPNQTQCDGGGWGHGPDARTLPGNTKPTIWKQGSQVEAGWGIMANRAQPAPLSVQISLLLLVHMSCSYRNL